MFNSVTTTFHSSSVTMLCTNCSFLSFINRFIIYKAPKSLKSLYIDSKTQGTFTTINDLKVLENTLQQLFTPIRKMVRIIYSEQHFSPFRLCSLNTRQQECRSLKERSGKIHLPCRTVWIILTKTNDSHTNKG